MPRGCVQATAKDFTAYFQALLGNSISVVKLNPPSMYKAYLILATKM